MSKGRKTHAVDQQMPHLTPCGRTLDNGNVLLAVSPAEPTCAWCVSYVRGAWGGAWGAAGVVTPTSEALR